MEWKRLLCDDRIRSYRGSGSSDLRTEFEKDYHRIIQSASFRRLQDKTQVFPLDRSDFIRTRLTHSLEVSSYGKSLGQNIAQNIIGVIGDKSFLPGYAADICNILQCAGLLHDIGNPPFGHFGETVIRDWFSAHMGKLTFRGRALTEILTPQMQHDFYDFEGNTQALRLVTKLHYLVDEHGMNLTKALLGTIIKYPISSLEIDRSSGNIKTKKMGYFYADRDVFEEIQKSLGTGGNRHPLAYILEAADDIAYLTADIEDAFKKGCISFTELLRELREYRKVMAEKECLAGKEKQEKTGREDYEQIVNRLEEKYNKAVAGGENAPETYAVQNWIVLVQGHLIASATAGFTDHYEEIMAGTYTKELIAETPGAWMANALGDIALRHAFNSHPILKLEIAAEKILNFLLDEFVHAVIYYDTDTELTAVQEKLISLISDNYMAIYRHYSREKSEIEKLYLRLLLVTDEICGMTDSYAKRLYQELCGQWQG